MTLPTRLCLLVVDDEPDICDSIAEVLRHEFRVLTATSGAQGFRLMQENEVHLVITDQRMPRMTGVELLTSVRCQYPQAVRMLFTGYADVESIIAAINQGHIFRFLKKPCEAEELIDAARDAAAEYRRLVAHVDENAHLRTEVDALKVKVIELEAEVERLSAPR